MYAYSNETLGRCGHSGHGGGHGRDRHGPLGHDPGHRHGGGHRGPRGRRARRGDVRTALLVLLAEEPGNGYRLMQEIEERSGGAWRPSPGSVYPILAQLEDEGLISTTEREGQRVLELTDAGRALLELRDADAPAPWEAAGAEGGVGPRHLVGLAREVGVATIQVARAGQAEQLAKAQQILREARRSLYRILAEDPPDSAPEDSQE